jgi:hypothetical protein
MIRAEKLIIAMHIWRMNDSAEALTVGYIGQLRMIPRGDVLSHLEQGSGVDSCLPKPVRGPL